MNSDWHYQIQRTKRRRENMGRFEKFIEEVHTIAETVEEERILPLKKAIPDASKMLKKLANGVYGPKIKDLSMDERMKLTSALQDMMKILGK